MRTKCSLLITVFTVLFGSWALAETTTCRITENAYEDKFPLVKGSQLVWQGRIDGDWEVFLYDTVTGETRQVTDNDYDDLSPRTDGIFVVWHGFADGEWDVFLWDGDDVSAISDRGAEDVFPKISNGLVVWTSEPLDGDGTQPAEVILYDIETQSKTVLSAQVDPGNSLDDSAPKINETFVIWVQTDEEGSSTHYLYDLDSGTLKEDPGFNWSDSPQRDGDLRVSARHDQGNREIFYFHGGAGRYRQITDNHIEDRYPSISGNLIAWMAAGEIYLARCRYLSPISPPERTGLSLRSPAVFSWEGTGYEAFKVEFSGDPNFAPSDSFTFPRLRRVWLKKTTLESGRLVWRLIQRAGRSTGNVYWRVRGKDASGSEHLSEPYNFSIERKRAARRARRR